MDRKELKINLERIAYSSPEYSETAREALFALEHDEEQIEALKAKIKVNDIEILGATLLSVEEAKTLLTEEERAYRKWWWLCSPGCISSSACYVNYYGNVDDDGNLVDHSSNGVRPALKIKINNSNIKVGETFSWGGYEFKIISNELAWMYNDDIGSQEFRANFQIKDANNYETSDIKKFVDNWFKTRII